MLLTSTAKFNSLCRKTRQTQCKSEQQLTSKHANIYQQKQQQKDRCSQHKQKTRATFSLFVQVSLWAENPHCKREELGLPVSPTLGTVISLALIVTTGWVIAGAGRIIAGTGRVVSRASTGAHTTANTTEGVSRVVTHTHTFTATLLSLKAGWKNPF